MNNSPAPRLPGGASGIGVTAALLAALLAVNAVAVWGILSGRRSAEQAAQKELELQTTAHARSLEALLATLRGDFLFLSQSPPLFRFFSARTSADPLVRRWGRLDVEATLLLFLDANPAVDRIVVADTERQPLVVVGRRDGATTLLAREQGLPPPSGTRLLASAWPLGPPEESAGTIQAWIDPRQLLAIVGPGLGDRLSLEMGEPPAEGVSASQLVARVPVNDEAWAAAAPCWLVRREDESQLIRSVESLAGRYRTTVILNLAVMTLTLFLGFLAFRQVRRAARLEAANAQQARVRELERQLMHSDRLASVGRLAAGMAHEINNPLEGMANYLSLLEDDLTRGEVAEAKQLVGQVRHGLRRAAGIIRQVLTFSDPGHAPKEVVELDEVLRETVAFVRSNPSFRCVDVRVVGEPAAAALRLAGNRITLGQLFLNLLLNACQSQSGRTEADGGSVAVTVRRAGPWAEVEVEDRGPGFTAESLRHLFEPFYSTRGSSGLGLAVCRGIVLDHGGEMTGRNRDGGGAVITVRLPLDPAAETAADRTAPRRAAEPVQPLVEEAVR